MVGRTEVLGKGRALVLVGVEDNIPGPGPLSPGPCERGRTHGGKTGRHHSALSPPCRDRDSPSSGTD